MTLPIKLIKQRAFFAFGWCAIDGGFNQLQRGFFHNYSMDLTKETESLSKVTSNASFILRVALKLVHNVPAAPHAQSGLDSRVTGGQAASTAAIFTFVKRCTQFGRQCGAAYAAPDPVPGSPTCIAVLLDWTLGGRFNQNRTGASS